jgi:hypothetical protein
MRQSVFEEFIEEEREAGLLYLLEMRWNGGAGKMAAVLV